VPRSPQKRRAQLIPQRVTFKRKNNSSCRPGRRGIGEVLENENYLPEKDRPKKGGGRGGISDRDEEEGSSPKVARESTPR